MNAELSKLSDTDERELRSVLIANCRLSPDDLSRISDAMKRSEISFVRAAMELELVSMSELEDAISWARTSNGGNSSFVETAMRKLSSSRRDVVLRQNTPVTPSVRLSMAHEPYSARSEKIRGLRTELLLLDEAVEEAKFIAVLSPGAHEGRSQLSSELAIAFAQLGRRTLLVDADLRRPQLHAYFDTENALGLSQALANNEAPCTHPVTGLAHMSLLTAGPIPSNPLELLSDGRFQRLVSQWRSSYEFVVIDTPPVTQCADALAVATLVERVLVVSRAKHTPYVAAKDMLRRLETTQARILGAVINHF
jgi:receptor protein-tyrosine kinase